MSVTDGFKIFNIELISNWFQIFDILIGQLITNINY